MPPSKSGNGAKNMIPVQPAGFLRSGNGRCLVLGDANGQRNRVLRFFPAAFGIHPGAAHHIHAVVDGVEEQPHILDDKAGPPGFGLGLSRLQKRLDVLFCLSNVHASLKNHLQRRCTRLLSFQAL